MRRLSIVAAIAVLVSMLGQPAQAVGALPSVPREVSIAARAANELTLAWLAPASEGLTPIESYNVYFKPTLDPLWVLSQNVLAPTTSAVVTGLQSGVTYQFRVTAVNAAGESAAASYGEILDIGLGSNFSCAIRGSGSVWCWGANDIGQFGSGDTVSSPTPVQIPGLAGSTALTAGPNFACVIKAGEVWCFGDNSFGQLGNGSTVSSITPVAVVGIPEAVASIDAGLKSVCAVTISGSMYCWGDNTDALLGNGGNTSTSVAELIQGGVAEVSIGALHACALMIGNIVSCWGSESLTPTEMPSVPNALGVSVGGVFDEHGDMCAITSTREVLCWASITSPMVPVVGPNSVVQLSVGLLHACALTDTGNAWCWGTNNDGELGNPNRLSGTYIASGVPALSRVVVGGDAFSGYTCGTTPAGGLYCWGSNASGQIGNGTYVSAVLPAQIAGFGIQSANSAVAPLAVSGVTFAARTETSISLSWNALTPVESDNLAVDSYLIETSLDGATWTGTSVPGTQTAATVTGLLSANSYLVRVSGVTVAGTGTPSTSVSMRTSLTPDAVTGLTFVSRSGTTLSVAWNEPLADGLPILSYKVEWQTGIGPWQSTTVVGATSYTISPLAAATSYRVRVSATSAAGTGLPSAELSDRTSNPPDAVTGLAHVARTESTISISWDTPAADGLEVVTYEVQWFLGASTQSTRKYVTAPATSTTITGLSGASSYRVTVAAISSAGTGPASAELVDRTLNAPSAVTGIANAGRTGTSISLSWIAPDADTLSVLDYKVEWSTAGGSWSSKVVATTTATIDGLLGNTDYLIRISARSAAGLGAASTDWTDHTLRAPAKVAGIAHVGRTETSIEVSWSVPASDGLPITAIKLEWSRDGVNWPSKLLTGVQANLTQWNITSLRPATNYQIRITATSSAGTGAVSDLFSDRTAHEPGQVSGLTFVGRTAKSLSLSWTRPDADGLAITGYKIEASTDGITWSSQLIAGEVTSGTIAGLVAGSNYRVRVSATNAAGTGSASAELLDRTSGAPSAVGAIAVSARTSTTLSLSWPAPADDGSPIKYYLVEYSENGLAWNSFSVQNASALLTNLLAASSYHVRVIAVSDAGQSPASESQVVSTTGTRSGAVTVLDSSGKPVSGGSVTWKMADNSAVSTAPVTLNALGQFELVGLAPGQLNFTVTNAELADGTRVSGEFSLWFGFSTAQIYLPASPSTSIWNLKVKLPSGRPVVGAKVTATGLSNSVVSDGVTFSTGAVTAAGVTDSLGALVLNGFATETPSVTVSYFDGLKKVTAESALVSASTVVTLADATWVKSAFSTKTVTVGQKVEIVVSALNAAGAQSGIAVKILAPKGAVQTGCGAVLKGTTNAAGKVKLYVCATKSGQYKLSAVGAVVTSTVTLLATGTAPMPVTRLTVRSLEPRVLTIGWMAPPFNGGSKITEYRVTATGGGKVIKRVLTGSNVVLRGLTSGTTYKVDVVAKNVNGLSEVSTLSVAVA